MKVCVYTVLFGDYEELNEQPAALDSKIPFFCFTDSAELRSQTWRMRVVKPDFPADLVRSQRRIKILPHRMLSDFDVSLYIDNTVLLKLPPEELLREYFPATGLTLFSNNIRETLADVFAAILDESLEDPARIREQLAHYWRTAPEVMGEKPYWSGLLIRDHRNALLRETMGLWDAHVMRYSRRDQASANVVFREVGLVPDRIEGDIRESRFHSWGTHRRARNLAHRHFSEAEEPGISGREMIAETPAWFSEESFRVPEWLPGNSAWRGHAPFAFWLVGAMKPRKIVELGTFSGLSYMAFCEAVARRNLPAECFAVDSWRGDPQAGPCPESIYLALKERNERLYRNFSKLLRMSFDEAAEHFSGAEIDLLHIDGFHSYEAAKHDFDTWLPKMSDRGVVLFHDIAAMKPGFGVWRLWEELRQGRKHFRFEHSSGLGVLLVGTACDPALESLFSAGNDSARIRRFYAHLGSHLDLLARVEECSARAKQETGILRAALDWERNLAAVRANADFEARRRLAADMHQIENLRALVRSQEARIGALSDETRALENTITSFEGWQKSWWNRAFHRWHRCRELAVPEVQIQDPPVLPETGSLPGGEREFKDAFRNALRAELEKFFASGESLILPESEDPLVSVIVVVWNQPELLLWGLQSLLREKQTPLEVVLADNGSGEETRKLLSRLGGAFRVASIGENIGYPKAVNLAAKSAKGKYILLLNSDAAPRPGSIGMAVAAAEASPQIAGVGGRLILPSGKIQEAGSILWSDATCSGYGRGLPDTSFACMFRRDVDYCSAAFLLIRKEKFFGLGGFDERFSPGYYEDSDFCLRAHQAGLRIVYEPLAVVDHFEFGSSGGIAGSFALQRAHREKFVEKHADALAELPPPGDELFARSAKSFRGRILLIDDAVPFSWRGSGFPRAKHMLRILSESGYFVTHCALQDGGRDWGQIAAELPREVEFALGIGPDELAGFLEERAGYYGAIIVSRPHNMEIFGGLLDRHPGLLQNARLIYDAEAIGAEREISRAAISGGPMDEREADALRSREYALAGRAERISVVSENERAALASAGNKDVKVVSHGTAIEPGPQTFRERNGFLFVGRLLEGDAPNSDAMLWFLMKVLPALRRRLGEGVVVTAAGPSEGSILQNFQSEGLLLPGVVDDLSAVYGKARVFIAPGRYGAGIPLKVIEAAGAGLPVVSTKFLANQIGWENGRDLMASDFAEEFAEYCAQLHESEGLWNVVRENALRRVREGYSMEKFRESVRNLVEF